MRPKKRVRMHLIDEPNVPLPTIEGLLKSKGRREYVIAIPSLVTAVGKDPTELESRWLMIPRERVAFYEVLS